MQGFIEVWNAQEMQTPRQVTLEWAVLKMDQLMLVYQYGGQELPLTKFKLFLLLYYFLLFF